MSKYSVNNYNLSKTSNGFSAELEFPKNNPVFMGHYPGVPIFPASLVIDICCEQIKRHYCASYFSDLGLQVYRSIFKQAILPDENVKFVHATDNSIPKSGKIISNVLKNTDQVSLITFKAGMLDYRFPYDRPDLNIYLMEPAIKHLPQRYPLLVIDLICLNENHSVSVAIKYVSYSDYCYHDTYITEVNECMLKYPDGAVIEGIEQAGALLLAKAWLLTDNQRVITIGGIDGVMFYGHAFPGDTIKFYTYLQYISESNAILSGMAMVNDRMIMAIEKIFVVQT